jgi:hypothetical protein
MGFGPSITDEDRMIAGHSFDTLAYIALGAMAALMILAIVAFIKPEWFFDLSNVTIPNYSP